MTNKKEINQALESFLSLWGCDGLETAVGNTTPEYHISIDEIGMVDEDLADAIRAFKRARKYLIFTVESCKKKFDIQWL